MTRKDYILIAAALRDAAAAADKALHESVRRVAE